MAGKPQFDVRLGGSVEPPLEVDTLRFATARAQEIAAISKALEDAKGNKLIFQRLPRHMRRRVMGHSSKRIPRSLREAYTQQLLKSGGSSVKSKKPSRKHRRRPANLLEEYNRRQHSHVWLETHIWHAKRFHMTKCWGYQLAHFPNDRSYRACYRAAANHCLLQDISFLCCIELIGPLNRLLSGLSKHTNSGVSLTFGAQSLLDGQREGQVMFYESDQYPWQAFGYVSFLWKPTESCSTSDDRNLWIWAHPAFYQRIVDALSDTFNLKELCHLEPMESITTENNDEANPKKNVKLENGVPKNVEEAKLSTRNVPFERTPKYRSLCGTFQMFLLKDTLNRFRLTGPLSQAVLEEALHPVHGFDGNFLAVGTSELKNEVELQSNQSNVCTEEAQALPSLADGDAAGRKSHHDFWHSTSGVSSPAELPPRMVLSLTVKDPRLQIPEKRIKAEPTNTGARNPSMLSSLPLPYSSPLWSASIRDVATKAKLSTAQLNALRSKLLVPGILRTNDQNGISVDHTLSTLELSVNAKIPLILIQRPGSQDPSTKRLGFGCGWDIIIPAGWGMPFWLAFIFRCARPAGLREASNNEFEKGHAEVLPPDTEAGLNEMSQRALQLRDTYFKLPPAKRPNFIKLGVACPFQGGWSNLIRDWIIPVKEEQNLKTQQELLPLPNAAPSFYVLRNSSVVQQINNILSEMWSGLQKKSNEQGKPVSQEPTELKLPTFSQMEHALLPVRVESLQKGVTDDMSLICLPSPEDVVNIVNNAEYDLVEVPHMDGNHDLRQKLTAEHKKLLLRLRKQRVRAKRRLEDNSDIDGNNVKSTKQSPSPTEDLVAAHKKKIENLWLLDTSKVGSVRNACSRETAGFVTRGNFSFTEAKGCGTGYVTYLSLQHLLRVWFKHFPANVNGVKSKGVVVLMRAPQSFQYRLAKLSVIVN